MHSFVRLAVVSAGIGTLAGMRSMSALALAGHRLASRPVAALLKLVALGEMAMDKTPLVPARTEPIPLAGRIAIGGAAAGFVVGRVGGPIAPAVAIAAASAAASAHLLFQLRRWAGTRTRVPDPVLGAVEDGVVVALGARLNASV